MSLIERGVWSDEVESICKSGAMIVTAITKSPLKWQALLPEKYLESATLPEITDSVELKTITRSLSQQLDAIAKEFANAKR
jgi:hypothetical protein